MLRVPGDFLAALEQSGLDEFFREGVYVPRRDYLTWIRGARRKQTRLRRIHRAIRQLSQERQLLMRPTPSSSPGRALPLSFPTPQLFPANDPLVAGKSGS